MVETPGVFSEPEREQLARSIVGSIPTLSAKFCQGLNMPETPEKIEEKKPEPQQPDDQDFPLGKACDLSNEEGCEACQ